MADVSSATCDFCGELKKEANHWYRVWIKFGIVMIMQWVGETAPYDLDLVELKHLHACGEDHALKLAARLLGKSSSGVAGPEVGKSDAVHERGGSGDAG